MQLFKNQSTKVLYYSRFLLILILILAAGAMSLYYDVIIDYLFPDFKTGFTNIILNLIIICLFGLGIMKVLSGYRHYSSEEKLLDIFKQKVEAGKFDEIVSLPQDSIIVQRYLMVKELYDRKIPINHGVISSIMTAKESLYQSFPKFINNVLILTGVFGTIVSLTIALFGASNVLSSDVTGGGINTMISGMNTALITSATAMVCFFVYTYFYQKFTDLQTYVFAQIEETVLFHIIPHFAFDTDTVNHETKEIIREINGMLKEMRNHTDEMSKLGGSMGSMASDSKEMTNTLKEVKDVLLDGFSLKN